MSLPFIVDSLDDVKEEHRGLYVEEDGKFRLDLDGYEDPKGLKSALQASVMPPRQQSRNSRSFKNSMKVLILKQSKNCLPNWSRMKMRN